MKKKIEKTVRESWSWKKGDVYLMQNHELMPHSMSDI